MQQSKNKVKLNSSSFQPALNNFSNADEIQRPSISFIGDVWRRLRKNKLAFIGLIIIAIIIIMCIIGPIISPFNYMDMDFSAANETPNLVHWFGTDDSGRDLFARAWQGGRVSLTIGFAAALVDFTVGLIIGGLAGYVGGSLDNILMRFAEIVYSIPYMIMVILISIVSGNQGIIPLIAALSFSGWVPMARLVRGQVMQIKEMEYVHASKEFGGSTMWILFKHILPNIMGPVIVNVTLTIPRAIFSEATLSYLGLGVQPPNPSWGQMASDAVEQMLVGNWNTLLVPSILICLTMFSFNILGDGLRDALDPKMRK